MSSALAERLRSALVAGDAAEHRDEAWLPAEHEPTDAAVLVAITDRAEPGVILTQRPDWLRTHAGQVAFPGGRMDPGDAGPIDTALREAQEEVGLDRSLVELVGTTAPYHSASGFRIVPVLGVIPPDLPLVPHEREVVDIFEVPLAFLIDPANAITRTGLWRGVERPYLEMPWQGRRIWGVTAGIMANLARRLSW